MNFTDFDRAKAETLAAFKDEGPNHINCAQAVVHFVLGSLGKDRDTITVARYLGGGVSGMGGTCGAVTGAALALGFRDLHVEATKESVAATHDSLKELTRSFERRFGACSCSDLSGHDLSTAEGMHAFKASEDRKRCPLYIEWMCDHMLPLLAP